MTMHGSAPSETTLVWFYHYIIEFLVCMPFKGIAAPNPDTHDTYVTLEQ
jgi:hypothetical protein